MTLWDLKKNQSAQIEGLSESGTSELFETLKGFGISENCTVTCVHTSVLGGPKVYEIEGKHCSLCKDSASSIKVITG
jgi:Fe2+ transport system protein FeoA